MFSTVLLHNWQRSCIKNQNNLNRFGKAATTPADTITRFPNQCGIMIPFQMLIGQLPFLIMQLYATFTATEPDKSCDLKVYFEKGSFLIEYFEMNATLRQGENGCLQLDNIGSHQAITGKLIAPNP